MTRARTCPGCGARWTLTLNPGAPRQPWHDDPNCADCRRAPAEAQPEPAPAPPPAPDLYSSLSTLLTAAPAETMHEFTCPRCGATHHRRIPPGHPAPEPGSPRVCSACRAAQRYATVDDDGLPVGDMPGAWIADGLCAQTDPEIFYPTKGSSTREAKAVCARCTVIDECRTWAIDTAQTHGVWGGLSPRERSDLAEQRATAAAS